MNIFIKIKNAIYNPKYYSEVLQKPFSYSFKYLLVFALLFALVFTIVATIKVVPVVKALQDKAPELANYFPQDLVITIKDGVASTNAPEPYFIKIPTQRLKDGNTDIENFIVIDTKTQVDLDKFRAYKTFVMLSKDSIIYMDDNGKISAQPLSSVKDFKLDRGVITDLIDKAKPFIVVMYPVTFVGAYIIGYATVIWKMAYLLFGTLLIWIIAKVKKLKIGYKGSYKVGMQLVTAPIIVVSILSAFSVDLKIPFLFSILLIIMAALNLKKEVVVSLD